MLQTFLTASQGHIITSSAIRGFESVELESEAAALSMQHQPMVYVIGKVLWTRNAEHKFSESSEWCELELHQRSD